MLVDEAIGNDYGDGVVLNLVSGVHNNVSSDKVRVKRIRYGLYGATPTTGRIYIEPSATNNGVYFRRYDNGLTLAAFDDLSDEDMPDVSDVRLGVSYGLGGYVGALAVPLPAQVVIGVATDGTVGTAALTPEAVWTYVTRTITSGGVTAGEVADAVWDEALSGHSTAGTSGKKLTDLANADLSGVATSAALATVDGIVDTILADTNELQSDWADGGRLDLLLDAAGSAGDPWATELPGAYGSGTAGEIIGGFSDDLTTAIAGLAGTSTVTVINTVDGGDAAVYQYATWNATFTLSGTPGLTDYENVIFCVKDNPNQADSAALLYVDTATGLKYIGGQAASAAGKGVLTVNSATAFNVYVAVAEVAEKLAGTYSGAATWELKGIETGTTPDEAMPIATGTWRIVKGNIRAIA
jgi:DNA-binding transcriptional regulator YdaS (Cro superfamily)